MYDEIWVAGPAPGTARPRPDVGVRDEDVPRSAAPSWRARPARRRALPRPTATVLYAPTWEGWTDDLFHTSLTTMGPRSCAGCSTHPPPTRLIYKPHPLTGTLSTGGQAAHRQIVALIEAHVGHAPAPLPRSRRRRPRRGRATRGGHLGPASGQRPPLYDCFNHADLLITDISSLVSDFVASGKPYAVTNAAGLPEQIFHERYPSTEAGVLLGEDLAGLAGFLDGADTLAAARDKLRTYLLGPEFPDGLAGSERRSSEPARAREEAPAPGHVHGGVHDRQLAFAAAGSPLPVRTDPATIATA